MPYTKTQQVIDFESLEFVVTEGLLTVNVCLPHNNDIAQRLKWSNYQIVYLHNRDQRKKLKELIKLWQSKIDEEDNEDSERHEKECGCELSFYDCKKWDSDY